MYGPDHPAPRKQVQPPAPEQASEKEAAERTTEQLIQDLTNGVGEKPYCRRVNGRMVVFVADDQEYCTVGEIDNYDVVIAEAICEAGGRLQEQSDIIDKQAGQLEAKDETIKLLEPFARFYGHIKSHLKAGQVVVCKICGKSKEELECGRTDSHEAYIEQALKGNPNESPSKNGRQLESEEEQA